MPDSRKKQRRLRNAAPLFFILGFYKILLNLKNSENPAESCYILGSNTLSIT